MPGVNRPLLSLALTAPANNPSAAGQSTNSSLVAAPLSTKLWGLDLTRNLPHVLSHDGITAVPGDLTRIRTFIAEEFPAFGEEIVGAGPNASIIDAKRWYLASACDAIELRANDLTVGVFVGAPEDWSSYYIRTFAVIQMYQRHGLIRRFMRECVFGPMESAHIERIVADTSPANLAMARCFSELHFHATGHQLSERWGPLVRYTRFLDPACEAAFCKRFAGIAPDRATRNRKEETP